jgi:hypothetical protein
MNPFEIVCSLTGDRAEAETADAALTAAAQLCRDHQDAVGTQGALKAARADHLHHGERHLCRDPDSVRPARPYDGARWRRWPSNLSRQ